jgi:hypothetical protein
MNSIEIFIPRILGSIKKHTVINTFKELRIGNITKIDMHKKINENNNAYSFAFISLDLYNNEYTKTFKHMLDTKEYTRLTYDYHRNQYWEIKKHILPEFRAKTRIPSPQSIADAVFFDNDFDNQLERIVKPIPLQFKLFESHFTQKDKDDLVKEYEELEMEILEIFNANTIVSNHLQSYKLYTLF